MVKGTGLTEGQIDHRRPEVYPNLPDWEADFDEYEAHPDGRPWRKACSVCALRTSDPQGLGAAYQDAVKDMGDDKLFYCVHRQDEGFHRICACFAACRAGRAVLAERGGADPSPTSPGAQEDRSDG